MDQMRDKMAQGAGFIAALDQSGGSTPKALKLYGIEEDTYSGDEEMFNLIHDMRARIATSPAFNGDKVIGAILFEQTMDRDISGRPSAEYLWEDRGIVPFLKIDKGLEALADDVQLLKPIPGLDATLARAKEAGIYGTKMRSVISGANAVGIAANIEQQFEIGKQVLAEGMMPILEPEVTISIPDKSETESMVLEAILKGLDDLPDGQEMMFKLTLPETPNQYKALADHPKVLRIVALSGGYSRNEANARLAKNTGMIASFSRALTEGLRADQDDAAFNTTIAQTIDSIAAASISG